MPRAEVVQVLCLIVWCHCGGAEELPAAAKEALPNIVKQEFSYAVPNFVKRENVEKLGAPLPDDVFVASWPKSGTNWMKQIVHAILIRGDPEKVRAEAQTDLSDIVPYLEGDGAVDHSTLLKPRVYQTHLTYADLPKGGRVIYVVRDMPDIALSFYKYVQQFTGFLQNNTADEVANMMMGGMLYYGLWDDHIATYWQVRDRADVLWVKFEDLKKDREAEIARVAGFLGVQLDAEEARRVAELSSFEWMKKNAWRISGKEWALRVTGTPVDPDYALVNEGKTGNAGRFTPEIAAAMEKYWADKMQLLVGAASYAKFRVAAASGKGGEL